jgi:hypothetical protein
MFDPPPPDPGIEIVIASQGMSKGLRQSDGMQFVARGEVAFGHAYAGLLVKNVTSPVTDAEGQAFVGYRTDAGAVELNGSIGYHRQLGVGGRTDDDRFEFFLSAARAIGPVTARLAATFSPDEFGAARQSLYLEGGASVRVLPDASLSVNIGRRERGGAPDYTAFNVGGSYTIGRVVTLDLRYYDTAQSGLGEIYEPRLVGSVRLRF